MLRHYELNPVMLQEKSEVCEVADVTQAAKPQAYSTFPRTLLELEGKPQNDYREGSLLRASSLKLIGWDHDRLTFSSKTSINGLTEKTALPGPESP